MQKLLIFLLASTVMLAISACTTPEQRYAQEQRKQAELRAAAEQRQRALAWQCRNYGFEPQTTAFSQCLLQLDQAQQQAALALKQSREQDSRCELARSQQLLAPTGTGSFGEALQRGNNAYNACMSGLPAPRSKNIICQRQGPNDVYCFSQ
jgi:hypothetical protein